MNTDKTFEFYLKKDDSTYFAVQDNVVIETATKTPLRYSPAGWDDIELSWKRNDTYWGVFRKYAFDLRFVKDGRDILIQYLAKNGFYGRIYLMVEKLDTYSRKYKKYYECQVDLTQSKIEKDYFDAVLLDDDITALITSNKSAFYEFQTPTGKTQGISIDGFKVGALIDWTSASYTSGYCFGAIPLTFQSRTSNIGNGIVPNNVAGGFTNNNTGVSDILKQNYLIKSTVSADIHFKISNLKVTESCFYSNWNRVNSVFLWILKANGDGDKIHIWDIVTSGNTPPQGAGTFTDSAEITLWEHDITVNPGDIVSLIVGRDDGTLASQGASAYIQTGNLNGNTAQIEMDYTLRVPATLGIGTRYFDFVNEFIKSFTTNEYTLKSDFLSNPDTSNSFRAANFDNSPWNTLAFSAYCLLQDVPNFKTTFEQIQKDVFGRWMCGIGIEGNQFVIEPLSYFLNKDKEILSLSAGQVASVSLSVYDEKIFNLLYVGYKSYDDDQLGLTNEFNTGQQYSFTDIINNLSSKDSTNDLRSDLRADIFGIEYLRMNKYVLNNMDKSSQNSLIDTTDDSRMQGIFLIEYDPDTAKPYRPTGTVSGFHGIEEAYNLTLSPKRSLYRLLPYIKSMISKGKLKFQTTDKNPDVQSNFFAGNIVENADIDLESTSAQPLFQWVVFEIEAAPPYNLIEILEGNLNGYISFTYNDTVFKGFILDVGCKPAVRDKYTFKLLSHPDNDLTKLR